MMGIFEKECIIRPMQLADMGFLLHAVEIVGWNQIDLDWCRYINFAPDGCFIAELNARQVGTVTTLCYEDQVGWIGMLIVTPQARGLGIGSTLMKHAIDYLQHRVQVIKLDATLQGLPIYKKLGFQEEFTVVRVEGKGGNVPPTHLQNITVKLLPKIIEFDQAAFGVSRKIVLQQLLQEYQKYTFYETREKEITGYIMATRGKEFWHVGPWVAINRDVAENLLNALLTVIGENRFVIDVPRVSDDPFSLCTSMGFKEQRRYMRMFLGENKWPGNPSMVYGTGRAEKG